MSQNSCPKCGGTVEANAVFCTSCGTRLGEQASQAADTTPNLAVTAPAVATSTASSSVSAAPALAVEPTTATSSQPEFGKAPSGRRIGPVIIVVLLLVILGAAALLWLWPATRSSGTTVSSASKVLILTPELSTITVEPNATASLGVAVQGDGGAGVTWKVAENYGGTVVPAGVTLQGNRIVYQATYHSGGTPGDYHVIATSQANKDVRVSIAVHVQQ